MLSVHDQIDVAAELNNLETWDVVEALTDHLFVVSSGPSGHRVRVRLDQDNAVSRVNHHARSMHWTLDYTRTGGYPSLYVEGIRNRKDGAHEQGRVENSQRVGRILHASSFG